MSHRLLLCCGKGVRFNHLHFTHRLSPLLSQRMFPPLIDVEPQAEQGDATFEMLVGLEARMLTEITVGGDDFLRSNKNRKPLHDLLLFCPLVERAYGRTNPDV